MVPRNGWCAVAAVVTCLVLAGCGGWSTAPTGITTSGATLHAQGSCTPS